MGPGGLPCCLGPDGDTLLTWEGKALLGPQVGSSRTTVLGFSILVSQIAFSQFLPCAKVLLGEVSAAA
jgi:hypothetical protein